jgi:dGTPase
MRDEAWWCRWLSIERREESSRFPDAALQSDLGRVLNSTAFRRLGLKTQVFPLEDNAAVRNRLTHSLEVAAIARSIAWRLCRSDEVVKVLQPFGWTRSELERLVEVSCLLHDIGNPPFGHFGECAIRDWVAGLESPQLDEHMLSGAKNFDGNTQGFRILTRLSTPFYDGGFGLNLTRASLWATMKYPWVSPGAKKPEKAGWFAIDGAAAAWLLGSEVPSPRSPVSWIMEAADDLAYSLSDYEDAIEHRLYSAKSAQDLLLRAFPVLSMPNSSSGQLADSYGDHQKIEGSERASFFKLKTKLISTAENELAKAWVQRLLTGYSDVETWNRPLVSDVQWLYAGLEEVRSEARRSVYRLREVEELELRGYAAIQGVLDCLTALLEVDEPVFLRLARFRCGCDQKPPGGFDRLVRLMGRIPRRYVANYLHTVAGADPSPVPEIEARTHLILDYVSGMTDFFVFDEHRRLSGQTVR